MATIVYLNGACVPADQPAIAPLDRGLLLGEGAFETLRAIAGQPVALASHLDRLNRTLTHLGIPLVLDQPRIRAAVAEVLGANTLTDARLRLTVTRGAADGPASVLISALPYTALPQAAYDRGVSVVTVAEVPHPRLPWKTTSHLAYGLVEQRARAKDAYEGLFIEGDAWIEGSRTNLIARIGDVLLVNDSPWALPGISRASVIAGAAGQGWTVRPDTLRPGDTTDYDGLYLTNALIEVLPVRTVDGRALAVDSEALRRLRNAYRETAGLPLLTGPTEF
jgi:branched-chain amino acid aminotransferase